ncbi:MULTISPECIES: hypothetical protein [unclassified Variovorax]|uniref:hypothetical protein n=1 Tax=unclassified Variovorax TaxID=663243 RepID=UPI003F44D083
MSVVQDFRLQGIDSLEQIEGGLTSVLAHRNYDLALYPSALDKRRGPLRDPAYLQLLLTWARLSPRSNLRLLINPAPDSPPVLEQACGYSVGIATIAVAGGVKVGDVQVPRPIALALGIPRMDHAFHGNYDELIKGRQVDLLCVSGAERQYLKPLFDSPSPKGVKDKFGLKTTVKALAARAAPGAELDDQTISALALLTHELFENTQDHAIRQLDGSAYRRHVELMMAGWLVISDIESQNDLLVNQSLRDYWAALAAMQRPQRQVQGLCFSFLDSGPGMAARLTGREYFEMPLEEEREALRACLRMHMTSKREHATGGGLRAVLTEVSQACGFVRVRSGRQAIFRSFAPGVDPGDVCENFDDWFDDGRALERVAGTLITVFIPVPRLAV